MQATKPLTNEDIGSHSYFLDNIDDVRDWTKEETAELLGRFIDTFGERDNEVTQ